MPNSNTNERLSEAVTVAVMGDEGILQVLDLSRTDGPIWKFPGGGVEDNETLEEAAVREVYEESGVVIKVEDILLIDTEKRDSTELHLHYFFAVQIKGTFEDHNLLDYGPVTGEKTRIISKDTPFNTLGLPTQRRIFERLSKS